jgi:hypothetical protein
MASFAWTDARVEVNSVNLSAYVKSVSLELSAEALDDTAMGDTYHSRIGGLKDWSVSVEFNADFGASAVDQTLNALLGTVTTIKVRPTSSSISATNPEYSGSVLLSSYTPAGGGVGELAAASADFEGAGTCSRATS